MATNLPILTVVNSRKRERDESGNACLSGRAPVFANKKSTDIKFGSGVETNEQRISNRQKQIQYGKNTIGYDNYIAAVPKESRVRFSAVHPRTPDPYEESSKRQFDGRVKAWRRELHKWDMIEDIAQVEIQVQHVASGASATLGHMEGVTSTSRGGRALIVMAPLCTPHTRVLGRANLAKKNKPEKSDDQSSIGGSMDSSQPANKRSRTSEDGTSVDRTSMESVQPASIGEESNDGYGLDLPPDNIAENNEDVDDDEDVL